MVRVPSSRRNRDEIRLVVAETERKRIESRSFWRGIVQSGAAAYTSGMSPELPLPTHLWDPLPPAVQALILALQGEVTELQTRIPSLQHQVQELQNQMDQSTACASQPLCPDPSIVNRPPSQSPGGEM
jgi:hypothetical protein